jgi:hypothetical protein
MAAGNDLHAAIGPGRWVERGPEGNLRIAVKRGPAVLVPGQKRAAVGRLVHEHGTKKRHGRPGAVSARADVLENGIDEVFAEDRVMLQFLDLAVIEARALEAFGLFAGVLVCTGGAVELHHQPVIVDIRLAEHDRVDSILQFLQSWHFQAADLEPAEFFVVIPLLVGDA